MTMSSSVHDRTVDLSSRRNAGPVHAVPLRVERHRTSNMPPASESYRPRHAKPVIAASVPVPAPASDTAVIDVTGLYLNVPAARPAAAPPPLPKAEPGLDRTRVTVLPDQGIAAVRAPLSVPESEQALAESQNDVSVLERILSGLRRLVVR